MDRSQKIAIMRKMKAEGKSLNETLGAINSIRNGRSTVGDFVQTNKSLSLIEERENMGKFNTAGFVDLGNDLRETGSNMLDTTKNTLSGMGESVMAGLRGEQTGDETGFQMLGKGISGALGLVGEAGVGLGKAMLPEQAEKFVSDKVQGAVQSVSSMENPLLQGSLDKTTFGDTAQQVQNFYNNLSPRVQRNAEGALGIFEGLATIGTGGAASAIKAGSKEGLSIANVIKASRGDIPDTEVAQLVGDADILSRLDRQPAIIDIPESSVSVVGKDVAPSKIADAGAALAKGTANYVTRAIDNVARRVDEAADLRVAIRDTDNPIAREALENNLEPILVNRLTGADDATKSAYQAQVDVARRAADGDKTARPSNVAGDAFIDQYKLIEQKRKELGNQMQEVANRLTKQGEVVDMTPKIEEFEDTLRSLGFKVEVEDGVRTLITKTDNKYSNKQRNFIKEIYDSVVEGNTAKTPIDLYNKDGKFATLNTEASLDQVQDLIFTNADGQTTDILSEARAVFSETLEDIAPEVKQLKTEYRPLAEIRNQVKKDFTKEDGSRISDSQRDITEFNREVGLALQREYGNSASGGRVVELAKIVDEMSRDLGYTGADPRLLSEFGVDLEGLYNIAPATSFAGRTAQGVAEAIGGTPGIIGKAIDAVSSLGGVSKEVQRDIIERLIEYPQ